MTAPKLSGSPQGADLLIARLIKLAGALIAVHEAVTSRDPATFAVASLMMTGGQGAENVIRKRP
jgi:hypothetical protein